MCVYIYIYISNTEISHWLNFWAVRLIWLRDTNCFAIFCAFRLDSGTNIPKQNLKVTFCHAGEIPESRIILYTQLPKKVLSLLISTVDQAPPSTNVSHILAVSFLSLQIHIRDTLQLQLHSMTWLASMGPPIKCEHKALYVIRTRTVRGHCA
jgi:hypothetical protein